MNIKRALSPKEREFPRVLCVSSNGKLRVVATLDRGGTLRLITETMSKDALGDESWCKVLGDTTQIDAMSDGLLMLEHEVAQYKASHNNLAKLTAWAGYTLKLLAERSEWDSDILDMVANEARMKGIAHEVDGPEFALTPEWQEILK